MGRVTQRVCSLLPQPCVVCVHPCGGLPPRHPTPLLSSVCIPGSVSSPSLLSRPRAVAPGGEWLGCLFSVYYSGWYTAGAQ